MGTTGSVPGSRPAVAGIQNIGNTCYLAASLQAMASSPKLVQHITQLAEAMQQEQHTDNAAPGPSLAQQVASGLHAVYRFLVEGPDDSEVSPESLISRAAQGPLTQELAAILTALQPQETSSAASTAALNPRTPTADTASSSSNRVGGSSAAVRAGAAPAAINPGGLLSALEWYTPQGVLERGYQHDAAEAFEAVIDAVITELACWQKRNSSGSSGSSSIWRCSRPAGLQQLAQPVADTSSQQVHWPMQQQLLHVPIGLQPMVASTPQCSSCSVAYRSANCSTDTARCTRCLQHQQQQRRQQGYQQQKQQSSFRHNSEQQERLQFRLPVIGHTVDVITCLTCGYRFPRALNPFVSLPLPAPVVRSPGGELLVTAGTTLDHCLRRYSQPEVVDGVECLKCSLKASLAAATAAAAAVDGAAGDTAVAAGIESLLQVGGGGKCFCAANCVLAERDEASAQAGNYTADGGQHPHLPNGLGLESNLQQQQQQQQQQESEVIQQQWQDKRMPQQLPATLGLPLSQQQQLLDHLSMFSNSSSPLPPLDYQQLLQQSGWPWIRCKRSVSKQTRLARAPAVLVLQLQRSVHLGGGMGKVQGHVRFPMLLDLTDSVYLEKQQGVGEQQMGQHFGRQQQQQKCEQGDDEQHLAQQQQQDGAQHQDGIQQEVMQKQQQPGQQQQDGPEQEVVQGQQQSGQEVVQEQQQQQQGHWKQLQEAEQQQGADVLLKAEQQQSQLHSKQQPGSSPPQQLLYQCTAVIQHLGAGQASGHYIMYRRVEMAQMQQLVCGDGNSVTDTSRNHDSSVWLRVNDSNVCVVEEQEVMQCHATLLLYERC